MIICLNYSYFKNILRGIVYEQCEFERLQIQFSLICLGLLRMDITNHNHPDYIDGGTSGDTTVLHNITVGKKKLLSLENPYKLYSYVHSQLGSLCAWKQH